MDRWELAFKTASKLGTRGEQLSEISIPLLPSTQVIAHLLSCPSRPRLDNLIKGAHLAKGAGKNSILYPWGCEQSMQTDLTCYIAPAEFC